MNRSGQLPVLRRSRWMAVVAVLISVAMAVWAEGAARAEEPARHTLWRIQGSVNTVFLLGSVHLLREEDYPLPDGLMQAYAEADALLLELDLDDVDPVAAQALLNRIGRLASGTLADWMGDAHYSRAAALAAELDIDLERMSGVKPWYAALVILQLQLGRLGFAPQLGIDSFFSGRARGDGKPVDGLETLDYQLGIFDSMSRDLQSDFLLETLVEAGEIEDSLGKMIQAWRSGNTAELAGLLQQGFEDYPALYQRLVVERNQNWVDHIKGLLETDRNVLVIVGALHLVGEQSVIDLLRERGVVARQL